MKGLEGGQVCRFDGKIQSCVIGVGMELNVVLRRDVTQEEHVGGEQDGVSSLRQNAS